MSVNNIALVLCLLIGFSLHQRVALNSLLKRNVNSNLKVGVAKVDASLPVGVPLAGYNHGKRRAPYWPLPDLTTYTVFMAPSKGRLSPTWAKCAVMQTNDQAGSQVAFITLDMIGSDGGVLEQTYKTAVEQGLDNNLLRQENVIMGGSHSHSGPGAVSSELLWELAPATDIMNKQVRDQLVNSISKCLIQAQKSMREATLAISYLDVRNVTHNRRVRVSPYVKEDTVDHQMTVIRVDDKQTNATLAAIWNFAIHGVCFGPDNMYAHGDIMGTTNELVESQMDGTISMFFNADAGDVTPAGGMCTPGPAGQADFKGSHILSDYILRAVKSAQVTSDVNIFVSNYTVNFGNTNLNLTLARVANCTSGGILDICTWCSAKYFNCDLNLHLGSNWVENQPRFNAVKLTVGGQDHLIVTVPGEALTELGAQIKSDANSLGFSKSSIFGYSNNHLGYFAPAREYEIGGYESVMTFWGENTADMIRQGVKTSMTMLKK